jgi:hypothetical protein
MSGTEFISTLVEAFVKTEKIHHDAFGSKFLEEILIPLVGHIAEQAKTKGKVRSYR